MRPEEIVLCSPDEIRVEIRRLLRPGEQFTLDPSQGYEVEIRAEEKVLWTSAGFDERLVLLDAYGWLWFRTREPAASTSLWVRKTELTREEVARRAASPLPEDLDPAEIHSVYEGHSHGRKD